MHRFVNGFSILLATSLVACNSPSSPSTQLQPPKNDTSSLPNKHNLQDSITQDDIVLYMRFHDSSGIEKSSKVDADFYRVLIKELPNERYLVQDFFITGKKYTDPYILTTGEVDYVDNEDVDHSTNYYPIEGSQTLWYESGNKKLESYFKDNMPTGTWITFYENGQKWAETTYFNGKRYGTELGWNKDGILTFKCHNKHGKKHGDCLSKYSTNPDIYRYKIKFDNGKKIGIWQHWNLDGSIEKLEFHNPVSLNEIKAIFTEDQFKIFNFDVNTDGIDDLLISRVNDNYNLFQGDELYVLLGDKKGQYTLSLSTSNHNSDGGYHSYNISPRPNHNGFIIHTLFPDRGYNFIDYYTEYNNTWMLEKVSFHGVLNNEEQQIYNCTVDQNVRLNDDYTIKNELASGSDDVLKEQCPAPPTKFIVKSAQAKILTNNFDHTDPPNYYIKGDIIEAFDQNEDWVEVSYKNKTKFGWINKRDLKAID